jgi:squalene synthase HpnC
VPSRAVPVVAEPNRLRAQARAENFPVALRLLPTASREHLLAVYAVARLIDDAGDTLVGGPDQRRASLDLIEADLHALWSGAVAQLPVIAALGPTVASCRLSEQPFLDLVAANRLDQHVARYPTYADLAHYCSLSANPIGRIVLECFAVTDEHAALESDQVCTALQILEHCQDIGEDRRDRDRIYLPLEDLRRFGVEECELDQPAASPALRSLVAFEVDRAARLLQAGSRLVRRLRGAARLAVTGYVAGGLATADSIRRCDHDVLRVAATPRKRDLAGHALALLAGRG